jgi:6-pyruvoyltetrahydropterin/6-carboxytetrahydropterin synthase
MHILTVKDTFDAAHKLPGYDGACVNLHGHTWHIEFRVMCPALNELQMGMDFKTLKLVLKQVLSAFDHHYINDELDMPTAENIGRLIFLRMEEYLRSEEGIIPYSCSVWETEDCCATYYKDFENAEISKAEM